MFRSPGDTEHRKTLAPAIGASAFFWLGTVPLFHFASGGGAPVVGRWFPPTIQTPVQPEIAIIGLLSVP